MVNSSGQVLAAVIGAIPILKPVTLQTNTFAATATFIKITLDLKEGKSISVGDTLALIGNVAGLVGTVAFLAGAAPEIALVASAVAIGAALGGVLSNADQAGLASWATSVVDRFWHAPPIGDLSPFYFDSNGNIGRYEDIINNPNRSFGQIIWRSNSPTNNSTFTQAPPPPPPPEEVDGDGE